MNHSCFESWGESLWPSEWQTKDGCYESFNTLFFELCCVMFEGLDRHTKAWMCCHDWRICRRTFSHCQENMSKNNKTLKNFFFFLSLCFGLLSKMQSPSGEFHYRVMISRNSVLDFWKSKWVITFSKHLIEQYGFPVRVLLPPVGLAWS